nr:hypothetical protein [Azospirillaceae bacterium]
MELDFGLMPKLRFARASEALAGLTLSDDAAPLVKAGANGAPAALAAALVAADLPVDAIRLLAMALPRREAAWWACLAAREAIKDLVAKGQKK